MTLPVTDFIIEQLLEYDPNYDVGSGTVTTGLMIEPLSVILQPIVDELTLAQRSQSVLTILEQSDPDAFPEDIVDALASNVFVERSPGGIGSTVQRMRFFEPKAYDAARGVLIFLGPSGQRYTNSEAVAITKGEMSLKKEGSLFYVDVPLVAIEEGEDFNVDIGAITSMEVEPAGLANTTNLFKIDAGRDRETNTELIDRIKVAVTVRALVTGRGIIVTLTENFTSIVEVVPIGFGDPEMMRDIVYNVHIGGKVDVYIRTATLQESSFDVIGVPLDLTRQLAGNSAVYAPNYEGQPDDAVALAHQSIDRTNMVPVVTSIDGAYTFTEGVDYEIDDALGLFYRKPNATEDPLDPTPSTIVRVTGNNGTFNSASLFTKAGAFADVRAGMIFTVTAPAAQAGVYIIKTVVSNDQIEIIGQFGGGGFPVINGTFTVDEVVSISYEYNPVSIDVVAAARSAAREDYTIVDVPLLLITSVEELDPLSGEPTGTTFDYFGGFGGGGFGGGGFGAGTAGDYRLVIPDPTLRFSSRESNIIEFRQNRLASAVRVSYKYASAIPGIQAFIDDTSNRTVAASILAKHMVPVFVDSPTPIRYRISAADVETALTEDEMTELVVAFIDDLDEDEELEVSDLIDLLYDNGAVRVDIDGLRAMVGEIHHADGTIEYLAVNSEGAMVIPDVPLDDPTTKPTSTRNARFIAETITLERSTV